MVHFNSIDGGSEGAFLNKATVTDKTDEEAVFFEYTGTKSSDGGLISGTVTEAVPTLADGRVPAAVFYTVTVPAEVANGTLTVMNGDIPLVAGENQIEEGTALTITAIPDKGYQLKSVKVNGTEIKGNTFILEKESIITVEFMQDALPGGVSPVTSPATVLYKSRMTKTMHMKTVSLPSWMRQKSP